MKEKKIILKKSDVKRDQEVKRLPDMEYIVRKTPCHKPGVRNGK